MVSEYSDCELEALTKENADSFVDNYIKDKYVLPAFKLFSIGALSYMSSLVIQENMDLPNYSSVFLDSFPLLPMIFSAYKIFQADKEEKKYKKSPEEYLYTSHKKVIAQKRETLRDILFKDCMN